MRRLAALFMIVGLLLAACGDDDTSDATAPATSATESTAPTTVDPAVASTTTPDEAPAPLRIATYNAGLALSLIHI